jgi:hypothetical protein
MEKKFIQSIVNVLKKDKVSEFSVVPSANPLDHFTADQIPMVTSAGLFDNSEEEKLACTSRLIDVVGMKVRTIGTNTGPHTLMISVEAV